MMSQASLMAPAVSSSSVEPILVSPGDIGGIRQLTLDARALHAALKVGKDFSNWIKKRISKYDFIENQDFIIFAQSGVKSERGRPAIEYRLSLGMGKELAMVENNEAGRMVRRYFIECERKAMESQRPIAESVLQRFYTLPAGEYEKATKDERHPIDHARKAWVAAAAANGRVIQHSDSWKIIRGHFGNITRIDDLPAAWVKDAVRFCQEMLAHETMVKIREERELEERAERRATAALPAPTPEPAQAPLPVSIAQLDIAGIETAMKEATRRQLAYSEAVFNLMNKVRAPFWEREGRQASPALKGLMQAMARGLSDMQMTAAHAHNAVIVSAAIAVEGCKLLADEGEPDE